METSDDIMRIYCVASCLRDLVNEVEFTESCEHRSAIVDEIEPTTVRDEIKRSTVGDGIELIAVREQIEPTTIGDKIQLATVVNRDISTSSPAECTEFTTSNESYDNEPPALDMEYFTDLLDIMPTQFPLTQKIPSMQQQPFCQPESAEYFTDLLHVVPTQFPLTQEICSSQESRCSQEINSTKVNSPTPQIPSTIEIPSTQDAPLTQQNSSMKENISTEQILSKQHITPVQEISMTQEIPSTQEIRSMLPFYRRALAPIVGVDELNCGDIDPIVVEKLENHQSGKRYMIDTNISAKIYRISTESEFVHPTLVNFAKDKDFRVGLSKRQRLKRLHPFNK